MITAAIINWNSGELLRHCVRSLVDHGGDVDIVVIDNASTDDSRQRIREFENRVRWIQNADNAGFAGAVNCAFAETVSPYVLILNPDVTATDGAIARLSGFLDQHPRVAVVGAYVAQGYLPKHLPSVTSLVLENLGLRSRRGSGGAPGAGPVLVQQVAGAAMMIRREAFDRVHGFDVQFHPAWYEDVDFCRRVAAAGWQVGFDPAARFGHVGGYSVRALGYAEFATSYYRNQLRYSRRHLPYGLPVLRLSIGLHLLAQSLTGRLRPWTRLPRMLWGAVWQW